MEWTNYVNDTTGAAGVSPEQQRVGTTGHTSIDPLDEVISQTPFENKKPLYSHTDLFTILFPLQIHYVQSFF